MKHFVVENTRSQKVKGYLTFGIIIQVSYIFNIRVLCIAEYFTAVSEPLARCDRWIQETRRVMSNS